MAEPASTPAHGHAPDVTNVVAIVSVVAGVAVAIAIGTAVAFLIVRMSGAGRDFAATSSGASKRPGIEGNVSLQSDPGRDIDAYRHAKQAQLEGYGWIDAASGIARIPIGEAMRLRAAGVQSTTR